MSQEIGELEKQVEKLLVQINGALGNSIMLLKELNHLTNKKGEFNKVMDTANEQFQRLMAGFPKLEDEEIPIDKEADELESESLIMEEVYNLDSDSNIS